MPHRRLSFPPGFRAKKPQPRLFYETLSSCLPWISKNAWGWLHTGHTSGAWSPYSRWPQLRRTTPSRRTSGDLVVLQVLHQLAVPLVVGSQSAPTDEHVSDAVKPSSGPPRPACIEVHSSCALGGGHQVLGGGADAAQLLEPQLGVLPRCWRSPPRRTRRSAQTRPCGPCWRSRCTCSGPGLTGESFPQVGLWSCYLSVP